MHVLITGGTGFVGRHLADRFLGQGHAVTLIGSRAATESSGSCRILQADTTQPGDWQQAVAEADLIVNLAGRTLFHRWSEDYKQQMYASRIRTTQNLVDALPGGRRTVLVSTSAVGYYGDGGDALLTESAPGGNDFLARLSVDWESAAQGAVAKGARVVLARFGIVLEARGGALAKMLPAFRMFAGGPLGSGRQWFSWIHMADLLAAIEFLAGRDDLAGPFNLCAPHPVRNRDLARTLGSVLGRPAVMPVPALALRLVMGEMAGVLLAGQQVEPERLLAAGFQFKYPHLEGALSDLLS
jgi:hypothetical protein